MAPWNKVVFIQEAEGEPATEHVINGDQAWRNGQPMDDIGRWITAGHAFQWMVLEVEDWFSGLEPAGEEVFGAEACSVWTGRDFLGGENKLYFEKETGLMKGLDLPDHFSKEGRIAVIFEEWQTLDGVQLPSRVTVTDEQGDFVLDFTQITLNDVDVAVFEGPTE